MVDLLRRSQIIIGILMSLSLMVEIPRFQANIGFVMPAQAGIQTPSSTWISFFKGMTDAVRHLDFPARGNDEKEKVDFNRGAFL